MQMLSLTWVCCSLFCALGHPAGAPCPLLQHCCPGVPVPGTRTALLVAVPRAWHHLQSCCHHPVSPARGWWLFLACKETVKDQSGFQCVWWEGKGRLQFCGPVSAPVRMSTRILNNHPDAGSLENVKPHSVVVLDTPTTGWLMVSPGGWAVSSRGCPTPSGTAGPALGFSAQSYIETLKITSFVNMEFITYKWKRPLWAEMQSNLCSWIFSPAAFPARWQMGHGATAVLKAARSPRCCPISLLAQR